MATLQAPVITPGVDYPILPRGGACLVCRRRKQVCNFSNKSTRKAPLLTSINSATVTRNATQRSLNVMNVFLLVVAVSMKMTLIGPGPNHSRFVLSSYSMKRDLIFLMSLQDRIKELEAQIRVLEEKKSSSSSTTVSEYLSETSSVHLSPSPGLSPGTSSSASSRDVSRTPITPTVLSADDIFPVIVSPSSPSSAYSTSDMFLNYLKSTGPDPPPHVVGRLYVD